MIRLPLHSFPLWPLCHLSGWWLPSSFLQLLCSFGVVLVCLRLLPSACIASIQLAWRCIISFSAPLARVAWVASNHHDQYLPLLLCALVRLAFGGCGICSRLRCDGFSSVRIVAGNGNAILRYLQCHGFILPSSSQFMRSVLCLVWLAMSRSILINMSSLIWFHWMELSRSYGIHLVINQYLLFFASFVSGVSFVGGPLVGFGMVTSRMRHHDGLVAWGSHRACYCLFTAMPSIVPSMGFEHWYRTTSIIMLCDSPRLGWFCLSTVHSRVKVKQHSAILMHLLASNHPSIPVRINYASLWVKSLRLVVVAMVMAGSCIDSITIQLFPQSLFSLVLGSAGILSGTPKPSLQ